MKPFAEVLLAGILWGGTVTGFAEAGCNAIPSADMLSVTDPAATAPAAAGNADTALAHFGFKGALGRIDRVHLLPGGATAMMVVPDGTCVDPASRHAQAALKPLEPSDDFVTLVYFFTMDGKRTVVRAYASDTACAELRAAAGRLVGAQGSEHGGITIELLPDCSNSVRVVTVGTSSHRLTIPVPPPGELQHAFESIGASPSVRVVVARRDTAPGALAALLERAATHECREICGALLETGGQVCIDNIFALAVGANGQATYVSDPVPCNVQIPLIQPNDFASACENDDATLPACQPPASLPDLKMWQDKCGGVHIPFTWTNINPQPATGTVTRNIRGSSGVGRKKSAEDPRIWVPGREFLGSTPIADPQGTNPGVDWRKPDIDVSYRAGSEEFGLKGTTDQPNSIVHVFPQLRADVVCTGTAGANACMGIGPQSDGKFRFCACKDRGQADCTCDPPLATARYFVCSSGTNRGMPCTRDQHCNPNGRCDGKPHCQEPGDVWLQTGTPDDTGRECMVKEDCELESTKWQCGYRLFNLQDGIETTGNAPPPPTTGIITLDAKILPAGPRKRRGACYPGGQKCGNRGGAGNPAACAPGGDCRGYVLNADGVQ